MQKVGDVSKNGRNFQKENRVGYPHPHSPPKPNNTTPFTTTRLITQIVNHPTIIVNLIKIKNTKNTKIIVKNHKILINFVEKLVNKNKKFIYIICISVTNENAPKSNRVSAWHERNENRAFQARWAWRPDLVL